MAKPQSTPHILENQGILATKILNQGKLVNIPPSQFSNERYRREVGNLKKT
jgi:hypothetical protein